MRLTREAMLRRPHLADEHYRRRAWQSFAEFVRYTKPDYQLSWFHERLAGELDGFLDDVLAKRSVRLIINVFLGKMADAEATYKTAINVRTSYRLPTTSECTGHSRTSLMRDVVIGPLYAG